MTYEEFEQLALNPPRPDKETVFVVTEIDMCALPEHRKNHYPKFKVFRTVVGYSSSLEGAETPMREAISRAYDADSIYCFHINEHMLNSYVHWTDYGMSWRLYNHEGQLIDHTWFDCRHYDIPPYIKFRGRPKSSIRFKAGILLRFCPGMRCVWPLPLIRRLILSGAGFCAPE
ncbi:MAG: hypothetical protein NC453_19310 [Muribaculum sp.]|nr:hypothetical protein [Muribaculum sp.]